MRSKEYVVKRLEYVEGSIRKIESLVRMGSDSQKILIELNKLSQYVEEVSSSIQKENF